MYHNYINLTIIILFRFTFIASSYDVRTGTYRLNFYSNVNTYIVNVGIKDDKLMEGTEAFGAQLILDGYHRPYCLKLGRPSITTVFIKDGMHYL